MNVLKTILKLVAISFIAVLIIALGCYLLEANNGNGEYLDQENVESSDYFTVVYRQPVNGYQVKAFVRWNDCGDFYVLPADIVFSKDDKSFTLHTECFGDTVYSKGRLHNEENMDLRKRYMSKTLDADYIYNKNEDETMSVDTPFFFMDLDFDGVDELVIVHYSMAVRYHSGYSVYRIVDGEPVLLNYPPYYTDPNEKYGMTDYPEFDYNQKTISCTYPEGNGGYPYVGRITYGVSKTEKDTVIVNGKKHFFNHIEPVEEIVY